MLRRSRLFAVLVAVASGAKTDCLGQSSYKRIEKTDVDKEHARSTRHRHAETLASLPGQ